MMAKQFEMRLSGSGGQGVILATIILAQAALLDGKQTAQSQSYGPEARGGMCKAETIISNGEIGFPKVQQPDFLLALTQESLEKFTQNLSPHCLVFADSELEIPAHIPPRNVIQVPILQTAREKVGKAFTANIVAVGAINAALKLVPYKQLEQAMLSQIPKGTEALNRQALKAGWDLIRPSQVRQVNLAG